MSEVKESENRGLETGPREKLRDDESAAMLVAQAFIVFSAIYWFLQIESVRALLELAYG